MKENNKKKMFLSILIALLIVIGVSSATYAVYKWRSSVHLNVDVNVTNNVVVNIDGGPNISGRIAPVSDYTEGIKKTIKIKSNLPGAGTFNLYLHINQLPQELRDISFKWMVTSKSAEYDYCGYDCSDFRDNSISGFIIDETNDINLIGNETIPYKQEEEYILYIWLDGENYDQDVSMGGKHIDFDLYITSTNGNGTLNEVIYE